MTKIDIISGFLGAGKTTLIQKLLADAYPGEKLVLIENEFGEISIDGGFLKGSGVQISEMSSGCICCSLVGDFTQALQDVYAQFQPDRILIEPSGVGKLSDVVAAVEQTAAQVPGLALNCAVTVADAGKVRAYLQNFGEFYADQVRTAGAILLSRTQSLSQQALDQAVALLRAENSSAAILTTPWDQLDSATIRKAMEGAAPLERELLDELHDQGASCCQGHAHHEHGHGHGCCGHHSHEHHEHDHGHGCCGHHGHEHHEHDHGHGCCGHHGHEHHGHDHGHGCCGHHEHGHGHGGHHHADEVFASWGRETTHPFTAQRLEEILTALDSGDYGTVLRAKGILPGAEGAWLHFDYVPGEHNIRSGSPDFTGRLCVIGAQLKEDALAQLFGL
ncbi:MAG TPA: GTP-binding protein [Firmicutes bacterium]|nr:GTP-binding protein [Bacillota bacterium]